MRIIMSTKYIILHGHFYGNLWIQTLMIILFIHTQNTLIQNLHSCKIQIFPHFLQEVIEVPLVVSRDWDSMWYFVNNIQFLYTNLIWKREQRANTWHRYFHRCNLPYSPSPPPKKTENCLHYIKGTQK